MKETAMSRIGQVSCILMLLATQVQVRAESASEAMKAFGLEGVWSPDCAKDPERSCQITATEDTCGLRFIYEAPSYGNLRRATIMGTPSGASRVETTFRTVARVTADKIKMSYVGELEVPRRSIRPWTVQK